jgi:hypothetical protein
MSINVHIERLILDGLPVERHQARLVQSAVEAELAQLLAAEGLASGFKSGGHATPRIEAPGIQLASDSSPGQIGQQIARAVYGGIGK